MGKNLAKLHSSNSHIHIILQRICTGNLDCENFLSMYLLVAGCIRNNDQTMIFQSCRTIIDCNISIVKPNKKVITVFRISNKRRHDDYKRAVGSQALLVCSQTLLVSNIMPTDPFKYHSGQYHKCR